MMYEAGSGRKEWSFFKLVLEIESKKLSTWELFWNFKENFQEDSFQSSEVLEEKRFFLNNFLKKDSLRFPELKRKFVEFFEFLNFFDFTFNFVEILTLDSIIDSE